MPSLHMPSTHMPPIHGPSPHEKSASRGGRGRLVADQKIAKQPQGAAELITTLDGHQPQAHRRRALLTIRGKMASGGDEYTRLLGPLRQSIGGDSRRQLQPAVQTA